MTEARRLSRRAFLLGGAGLVGAVAAGTELVGTDRVLHEVGLRGSPDHHVPASGWPLQTGLLASKEMRRHVRWVMARPTGAKPLDGVIVCLHGHGNDVRFAFDTVRLHDVVADVGADLAVASVDGGASSYWHKRADGTDSGAMLTEEFVPFVQQHLAVEPVALLGWSMGGYGALLAGERHPDRFPVIIGSSPALFPRAADAAPGSFDGAADYAANDVFAGAGRLKTSAVRIDCGTRDPFVRAVRAFVRKVPKATASFSRGHHDAAFWRSVAPAQVRFAQDSLTSR